MQRRSFLASCAVLSLFLFSASPSASAKEPSFADHEQSEAASSQSPELSPLPTQFTSEQIPALQQLPPAVSSTPRTLHRLPGFYRSAYNRPLTPREVLFRESVYELAARHRQFVHVRFVDGKVFTGTITFTSAEAFRLQTDLSHSHFVHYHQLAEPPRPVLAVGTKTVRGLEIGGIVVTCIVFLPVALVVYPLIAAGVIQD
jgi:hypothetical protein